MTKPVKMPSEQGCRNTDKEIWRKVKDDYYSPSIHITKDDGVGINVGGHVFVKPIEEWHKLAEPIDERDKLIKALKEYIVLLVKELNEVLPMASVHGWKSSRFEEGKKIREKIEKLYNLITKRSN